MGTTTGFIKEQLDFSQKPKPEPDIATATPTIHNSVVQ
jgi:hypothetical protein